MKVNGITDETIQSQICHTHNKYGYVATYKYTAVDDLIRCGPYTGRTREASPSGTYGATASRT